MGRCCISNTSHSSPFCLFTEPIIEVDEEPHIAKSEKSEKTDQESKPKPRSSSGRSRKSTRTRSGKLGRLWVVSLFVYGE